MGQWCDVAMEGCVSLFVIGAGVMQQYAVCGQRSCGNIPQLGNRCAEWGICFIGCMKDNQGNAFYEADPMPGGK